MKPRVLFTDVGSIAYWSVWLPILLGLEVVPAWWLFKDYDDFIVYAWNGSFFPLDMLLLVCGLIALRRDSPASPLGGHWPPSR